MTDIHAKRLRRLANNGYCTDILRNAADRIEELEAALRGVIAIADRDCPEFREARAALGGKDERLLQRD